MLSPLSKKEITRLYDSCTNPDTKRQLARIMGIKEEPGIESLSAYELKLLRLETFRAEHKRQADDTKTAVFAVILFLFLIFKVIASLTR